MYRFDLLTIFPNIFDSYLGESILKRARAKKLIDVRVHNIRDYATDKHHTTDDRPYGGGPGMVMKVEPIVRCLQSIRRRKSSKAGSQSRRQAGGSAGKSRIILLSAKGKTFDQSMARTYAKKYDHLILVAGRYEGIDERVMKYVDEEVSIGTYVLTGGELPSLSIIDAVTRLLPDALGDDTSSNEESFSTPHYREYPHYTRPEIFRGSRVPRELLSGNHRVIGEWRKRHQASKRSS